MVTPSVELYDPPDLTHYARPVQVESATGGLSIERLSTGQAIVMWPNANRVRYALLDNMAQVLLDDVVTADQIQTALDGAAAGYGSVFSCSVFRVGSNLFFSVMTRNSTTTVGRILIYIADSDSNPTSWSLYGTVQSRSSGPEGGFSGFNPRMAGVPYVDGSYWAITGGRFIDSFDQWALHAGVWESYDAGVSWTEKVDRGYYIVGGVYMDFQSPYLARHPATGELVTMGGSNAPGYQQRDMFIGPNTWTIQSMAYGGVLQPFLSDKHRVYALGWNGEVYASPDDHVWPWSDWTFVGRFGNTGGQTTNRVLKAGDFWYYSYNDRVARQEPSGGWSVKQIRIA